MIPDDTFLHIMHESVAFEAISVRSKPIEKRVELPRKGVDQKNDLAVKN